MWQPLCCTSGTDWVYNYHGLTFWQFAGKMIYFSFFNRPLVYGSTESVQELKQIYMETCQEEEREVQQRKKEQKKKRRKVVM